MNPKILYVSCAENGLYGLRHLVSHGFHISAVVTIQPEIGQRFSVSGYCDFQPYCSKEGLQVISLSNYKLTPEDLSQVNFDLIVVNGWNRLIESDVIGLAPMGGLGVHAGHPPIGLGRAPLVWNILLGRTDIEVYVFRLTPNADDGKILAIRTVEITPYDNVKHLYEKVMLATAHLFPDAIYALCKGNEGAEQDIENAVYYEKRTPDDGLIDFRKSEIEIYNFVRSQVPPYPGAFAWLSGAKWTILDARPFDRYAFRDIVRRPGTILCSLPSGIIVQTGGAPIWITDARVGDAPGTSVLEGLRDELIGMRFNS